MQVSLSDSELAALARLPGEWAAFQATLQNTEKDIEVAKDNFREKLVKIVDGFVKDVAEQRADFGARLPTSADVSVEEALRFIAEEKAKVRGRGAPLRIFANCFRSLLTILNACKRLHFQVQTGFDSSGPPLGVLC